MKKSELKQIIREVIEEVQGEYANQLYIRAKGANQKAGGTRNWLKIWKIEDIGDEYEVSVVINGMKKSVGLPKKMIDSGEGFPNLEFRIRSMPATAKMVIDQYFGKDQDEEEIEYYDKNGRPDPNGLYDVGGHVVRHPAEVFGE